MTSAIEESKGGIQITKSFALIKRHLHRMTSRAISQANSTLVFCCIGIYLIITANSLEGKNSVRINAASTMNYSELIYHCTSEQGSSIYPVQCITPRWKTNQQTITITMSQNIQQWPVTWDTNVPPNWPHYLGLATISKTCVCFLMS